MIEWASARGCGGVRLAEDADADEQRALLQIVEIVERMDERLTALEAARAERLTLDAEVEALKHQLPLH